MRVANSRYPSRRLRGRLALLLLIGSLPSAMAAAPAPDFSDLAFEDLLKVEITSASKFAQSSREAPSAVQVISADDIRRHGWRTLSEALDSLPGIYTVSDRVYDYVGARGFLVPGDYNTRFLLLLDGQRLNDNIYEQANFSREFQVDLALVERIEYVPGPGSSIYGSNALFGVINVITRSAASQPKLALSTHIGRDGWREARVAGAQRSAGDGPDIVLSISHATKLGRDLAYPEAAGLTTADGTPSADGVAHKLDRATLTRAFLGIRQGGLAVSAWAAKRDINPSSALYDSNFDDGRLRIEDAAYGLSLAYRRAINDHLDFDGRLAYQQMTYRADYPYFDAGGVGAYVNRDDTLGSWWSGEARLLHTGFADHKLVAGFDFHSDAKAVQKNFDVDVAVNVPLEVDTRGRRQGLYVQDEWHFARDWRLNAGLRRDSYSGGRSNTSPRLGLLWAAGEQTTLKFLAGRAYRVANAYETAYGNGMNYLANASLEPEAIRTLEAVAEYRPATGHEIGGSLFEYQLTNLIRQVDTGAGLLQFQNQPRVSAKGIETFYRWRRKEGPSLTASVALSRTRDEFGQLLANSPRWVGKLRGEQAVWGERVIAAVELNGLGRRFVDWGGFRNELGAQFLVNLTLTATRLAPGLEAQLRVINLLDRKILHPAADEAPVPLLPMNRRQLEFGLVYAF